MSVLTVMRENKTAQFFFKRYPPEIFVCVTSGDWDVFLLKPLPENR